MYADDDEVPENVDYFPLDRKPVTTLANRWKSVSVEFMALAEKVTKAMVCEVNSLKMMLGSSF